MDLATNDQRKRQGFQPGQSGNLSGTKSPRGLSDLAAKLQADLPGIEASAIDMALLRNAALLLLRAERMAAGDRSVRSSSEARRTLEALRKRYAKPAAPMPSESYAEFARRNAAAAAAKRAAELAADEEMPEQSGSLTGDGS
jgi:hypothetical protein